MVAFGIPTEGPRLVGYGKPRLSSDKLANGHAGFRVTQTFAARDYYWNDGRIHGALDCGNFTCGDRVIAAAAGTVAFVGHDQYGAKGVKLYHGAGYETEYWHLSAWVVGPGQVVKRGQTIGLIGGTGLAKGICHVHFSMALNGTRVDPWPRLNQPGTPLPVPHPSLRGRCRIAGPNCNIRSTASLAGSANIYARSLSDGYTHRVINGVVKGRLWSNGSLYVFLGWTPDGKFARVQTGSGTKLFISRSVVVVTVNP